MTSPLDALMDQIAPLDEVMFKNVLIYGDPGVGKTVLAATAPKPLFLDIENGYEAVGNHPALAAESKRMKFVSIKQAELLAKEVLKGSFEEYKTIVIDTITALEARALKEYAAAAFKKNPNDAMRDGDQYTPIGKDYQRVQEFIKYVVALFRDSDMHVIFLCHAKEEKDERTGVVNLRPMLSPKLAGKVLADCSIVGHMTRIEAKNGEPEKRFLQVQPSLTIQAKSRTGGLPAIIENPTFDMLVNPAAYFTASEGNK